MRRHLLLFTALAGIVSLQDAMAAETVVADDAIIAANTVQDGTVSDVSLASDFTGGVGASQSDPSGVTIQMIQQIGGNTAPANAPGAAPYARPVVIAH